MKIKTLIATFVVLIAVVGGAAWTDHASAASWTDHAGPTASWTD